MFFTPPKKGQENENLCCGSGSEIVSLIRNNNLDPDIGLYRKLSSQS